MKKIFFFAILTASVFLTSCRKNNDDEVREFTAKKVSIAFDENSVTPEMIQQYGEFQKQNAKLVFLNDSVVRVEVADYSGVLMLKDGKANKGISVEVIGNVVLVKCKTKVGMMEVFFCE